MRVYKSGFAKQEENIDFFMYKKPTDKSEKDDGVFYQMMKEKYRDRLKQEERKKADI